MPHVNASWGVSLILTSTTSGSKTSSSSSPGIGSGDPEPTGWSGDPDSPPNDVILQYPWPLPVQVTQCHFQRWGKDTAGLCFVLPCLLIFRYDFVLDKVWTVAFGCQCHTVAALGLGSPHDGVRREWWLVESKTLHFATLPDV